MQLKAQPRHLLLLAILVGLVLWNFMRLHHARPADTPSATGPGTPAWQAYDHAAALRDAPDPQFTPALDTLRTEANAAAGPDAPDLRNCLMWLEYYRHSVPAASGNSKNWGMFASSHVHTCTTEHRDVSR